MKRISLTILTSLILTISSLIIMLGWVVQSDQLIKLFAILPLSFNLALCFFLSGAALSLSQWLSHYKKWILLSTGIFISIISGITLLEHILAIPLGIDELFVNDWYSNTTNAFPGRMAINSALEVMMAGLFFIFAPFVHKNWVKISIYITITIILLVSISAIIGYLFNFQALYSWYGTTHMSLKSAIFSFILACGLWSYLNDHTKFLLIESDDKKILFTSMIILLTIAFIAGLTGFATSAKRNEDTLQKYLQETMNNRIDLFEDAIKKPLEEIKILENNADILEDALVNHQNASNITDILVTTSFSDIAIKNNDDKIIYHSGHPAIFPDYYLPLNLSHDAKLIWKNGFYLQLSVPINKKNEKTGTLLVEWPLIAVTSFFSTEESYICGIDNLKQFNCIPHNSLMENSNIFSNASSQVDLVNAAINHKNKMITDFDYKDHLSMVMYSPVNTFGIGFIVKENLSDAYKPLREQLSIGIPIILLTIAAGLGLLYWRIMPLIRQVILSKKHAEENENRFRLAFDSSAVGIALISNKGDFLRVNPAICELFGYHESELLKMNYQKITYPEDLQISIESYHQLLDGKIENCQLEKRYVHKHGRIIWAMVNIALVKNPENEPIYFIAQVNNITEKKKQENELSYHAYYDIVTGLANHTQLEQSIMKIIDEEKESKTHFALFYIDLDNYKQVVDSLGHDAGNQLLNLVADRLKLNINAEDIAARISGNAFAILIMNLKEPENAVIFSEKIINSLATSIQIQGHDIYMIIHMGISFYPMDGTDYQSLLRNADIALYQAKSKGKNTYQFCIPDMNTEIIAKTEFKKALQEALNNKEFHLEFQPRLDVKNNQITGVEALLRWKNQHYGVISPLNIISSAEEMGLIIPLSEWIIQSACVYSKEWDETGFPGLQICINVSAPHFYQSNFSYGLFQILNNTNIDAHMLNLEINENLIMQNPNISLDILKALDEMGVKITIDNFGTGYSSLTYLHRFAVENIKIDRSLIQNVAKDAWHQSLIAAIIALGKNLGMKVIAEGVETKEQFDLLVKLGIDEIQGYYFCHPLPAKKINQFLISFHAQAISSMHEE